MIVMRNIFQAQFGRGGELARLMAQQLTQAGPLIGGRWRLLTDLGSGPFDTVVMEVEVASLAALEEQRARLFADPQFGAAMAATAPLMQSGRAELYTLEAHGGA